ncbi:MAG: SagB/ThcOx family dehydrogenase [Desulfomonile tiedjei]|uniref:SagB/ThcOx family dehydrogenase n=1 Tax=Desulfomonile tiedjei TaxID=2358 RepID=A0A9D6Z5Y9_9BACT|nr:SagB/ThcOx family dehydrogenase [Desulfomonile tiedjei]
MTEHAWEFHRRTTYDRAKMAGHQLDQASQPDVFKIYPGLETISLPRVTNGPEPCLSDLLGETFQPDPNFEMDLDKLSRALFLTHALTAKARYGGTDFYYRSVASAGALYPCELYVGALNIAGLANGIYHHAVGLQALTVLGKGGILSHLCQGLQIAEETHPAAVFFITAIFYRSAWKYRARAYRYHLLDSGHMVENLSLALKAVGAPYTFYYDFDDSVLNNLLGLDPKREVCLAVACARGKQFAVDTTTPEVKLYPDLPRASKVTQAETDLPSIRKMHRLSTPLVETMDQPEMNEHLGVGPSESFKIALPEKWPELLNYPEAVFRRRSMRNFVDTELKTGAFEAFIKMLCSGDRSREDAQSFHSNSIAVGFLARESSGLEPGFYLLYRKTGAIALAAPGSFTEQMARVCLDQSWLANCAVHFLFMTNLRVLEQTRGPRGYRHALLAAGRLGQRIYIGAASMKIGCCGIGAFYDDEAAKMLGLNPASRLLYLVGVGPVKKWVTT